MPLEGYGSSSGNKDHDRVGDIFQLDTSSSFKIQAWHISTTLPEYGRRMVLHKIVFRHDLYKYRWTLILDGIIIGSDVMSSNDEGEVIVKFSLEGKHAYVSCLMSYYNLANSYRLFWEGKEITNLNLTSISSLGEPLPHQVSIVSAQTSKSNKKVTRYEIQSILVNERIHSVGRRYSEFILLDAFIRSQTSQHLLDSLPILPKKVYSPFVNQFSAGFIEKRRAALESYIKYIVSNEKVCSYSSVS